MPIYEYVCPKCGFLREVIHKADQAPFLECEHCRVDLVKQVSSNTTINFKGKWFKNNGEY